MSERLVWRDLVVLEPRLQELLEEAKSVVDVGGESFCANDIWYGYRNYDGKGLKPRMSQLVGMYAGSPTRVWPEGAKEKYEARRAVAESNGNPFIACIPASELPELVPDESVPAVLRSSKAYDVAYRAIYRALPDCRNCMCENVARL